MTMVCLDRYTETTQDAVAVKSCGLLRGEGLCAVLERGLLASPERSNIAIYCFLGLFLIDCSSPATTESTEDVNPKKRPEPLCPK